MNRIVNMWLDFAEDQSLRRKQVFLQDWQTKLDDFLRFNDRDVLAGKGTMTRNAANVKAKSDFDRYTDKQRRLKEADGERSNIDALRALVDENKRD